MFNCRIGIDWPGYDSQDCAVALLAAEAMAKRFRQDVAIMDDLSVVLLADAQYPPIEIVRFNEREGGRRIV